MELLLAGYGEGNRLPGTRLSCRAFGGDNGAGSAEDLLDESVKLPSGFLNVNELRVMDIAVPIAGGLSNHLG